MSFAREVREPAFVTRQVIANEDLLTLAHEILTMDDDAFRVAFKNSAMKRAKLAELQRYARVVLENER